MDSILTSIKKLLGISEEYEEFDTDIMIHINTAFSILAQLGVGPVIGYSIKDKNDKWSDFIMPDPLLEMIKTYMYLKVRMMFDPPTGGSHIEAVNRQINELEWRINVMADSLNSEAEQYSEDIKNLKHDVSILRQHDILSEIINEEENQNG